MRYTYIHTGRQAFIYIKSTFLKKKAMIKPGPGCSWNSSTQELEDQDLKVIFSHTVNLKLIWATRNPIKKKKEIRLGWVVIPLFSALKESEANLWVFVVRLCLKKGVWGMQP